LPRFDRLEFDQPGERPERDPAAAAEPLRDAEYWLKSADENRRRGLYENALRHYSRALEQDRSLLDGWLGQVQMLILLGEYPEADLWSRKALELFRNQAELLAARAQALCRMGDLTKAMGLSDTAMAQTDQSDYRWTVRGELMTALNRGMDRECFDKAVQCDADWLVCVEIALIYQFYRQPAKALPRIRRAVEKAPESPYAWYVQGCVEDDLGFTSRANTSLERCLELVPGYVEARNRMAHIHNRGWSPGRWLRRMFSSVKVLAPLYLLQKAARLVNIPQAIGKVREYL
jgi:tetratricopeptide (TPR) repeat protein